MNRTIPESLWQEWFDRHDLLCSEEQYSDKLAALFVGHVPEKYKEHPNKILYVGKATRGKFIDRDIVLRHRSSFEEQFKLHKDSAAEYFEKLTSGGFWPFADKLSKAMGG